MRHLKSVHAVATTGAVGCHATAWIVDMWPLSILLTQNLFSAS